MTHSPPARTVCLLARIEWGHHQTYADLVRRVLGDRGVDCVVTASPAAAVAFRGPVLVMHLEQYRLWAHLVVFARALLGRRTAALVFRSREALTGRKPQTRLKRALLAVERRLPRVAMMTILPHALLPGSERLFRAWIHDPQVWDVPLLPEPAADDALAARVRERAAGRPVIVAAGLMADYKGIDMLAALADDADFCARYLLVIAGRQVASAEGRFATVRGDCLIENRYISDGELYALYRAADYVWAVYAPSYDQASGIFGRAAQFGRTPVVRAGSLVDAYADYLGVAPVRVEWNASPAAVARSLAAAPGRVAPLTLGADESATALTRALFGEPAIAV